MDNKKTVIVWMNGKKTRIRRTDSNTEASIVKTSKKEQAATLDDDQERDNQIPTFTRQHEPDPVQKSFSNKMRRFSFVKPIILAAVSAIVIGGLLGIIMLKLVGTLDNNTNNGSSYPTTSATTSDEDRDDDGDEKTADGASNYSLKQLSAYVLQGGVFSEEANVGEWTESFENAGFSPITWERDGSYYLFVGISNTKEEGATIAEDIEEKYGLDVFAKEWNTSEAELQLDKEESNWLNSVIDLWNGSLVSVSNKEGMDEKKWQEVIDNYPAVSDKMTGFHETISAFPDQMKNADELEAQHILMQIWYQLDKNVLP